MQPTPTWDQFAGLARAESDIELSSQVQGTGETILLIHGFGLHSYTWRHLDHELAERYRVIELDLKGFGDSPKPQDGRYSIYDQARLIYQFIVEENLEDFTLVGHSFGGGVALVVALHSLERSRNRPKRLILIDSVAYEQRLPAFIRMLATPALGPLMLSITPDRYQAYSILRLAYYDDSAISTDQVDAYAAPLGLEGSHHAVLHTARQIVPSDITELSQMYPRIDYPTLILWGRQDSIVPLEVGRRLHAALPDSRLVVVDKAGHLVHEEQPVKSLEIIKSFLGLE